MALIRRSSITPRRLGTAVTTVALLVAALSLSAAPARANLPGSNFEGNDGNLVIDTAGNMDWNGFTSSQSPLQWSTGTAPYRQAATTVNGWTYHGFEDAQKSGSDTQFAGGVKQDDNCPSTNTSSSPNKDDLIRTYIANKTINDHVFVALAWVRIKLNTTNSSTHVGFEFNQGAVPCGVGSNLVQRTPGDMLIVYDFTGGSGVPDITLRRWVTSGACDISSDSAPCWGVSQDLSALGFAEAKVNTSRTVTDQLTPPNPPATAATSSTLGVDQFGEAAIDLSAAGVFPSTSCLFFGKAQAVSRSSGNSGNAAMEDLVGPGPVSITNCATKTFTLTFDSSSPPIDGTSVYALYTTPDGVHHALQLTRTGNTYTASDGTIKPGTQLTGVRLEIRDSSGNVIWKTSPDQTETINGDTTNSGTFSYSLTISPPKNPENFINTSHTFTAVATGMGSFNNQSTTAPLVGVTVNWATFSGTPANCGTLSPTSSTTDGNGQATSTISSATPCNTSIRAFINSVGGTSGFDTGEVSDTGSKTFVDYQVTVSPPSATNALGTNHTFTITLQRNSGGGFAPYGGQTVSFSISDPNNTGAYIVSINGTSTGNTMPKSGTCTTRTTAPVGTCTVVTTAPRAGTFTLNASYKATNDSGTLEFDGSGTKTFVAINVSKNACTTSAVAPGSILSFSIPWNTSGGALHFARIVDNLPAQMLFESVNPAASSSPAVGSSGDVVVPLADPLPSGSHGTVTLVVSIAPGTAAGTYTNSGHFYASNDTAADTTHTGIDVPFSATITVGASGASASGEAFGVSVDLGGAHIVQPTPDVTNGDAQLFTVPGAPTLTASLLAVSNKPTLTTTSAEDRASATAANVDIELSGLSVKAAVVQAVSDSTATGATANTLTNGSEVLGLEVNGTLLGDFSRPKPIAIFNALGVKIAEVDVLETTGASGAAKGSQGGQQPQGGVFSSGLTVNGLHVTLLQVGSSTPAAEVIVSSARSIATFPSLQPCGALAPYVVGEANIVHEVLTYPTGPTTALEGDIILPSTGGDVTSTINNLELGGVITSGTGSDETKGALSPLNAFSTATVQNLAIPGLSLTAVSSSATANGGLSGTTTILKLVIGSTNVCQAIGGSINKVCTPDPNTVLINIGGTLKIILNEQITDGTGKVITVNAVHIFVLGLGNPLGLPVGSDLTISTSIAGTS